MEGSAAVRNNQRMCCAGSKDSHPQRKKCWRNQFIGRSRKTHLSVWEEHQSHRDRCNANQTNQVFFFKRTSYPASTRDLWIWTKIKSDQRRLKDRSGRLRYFSYFSTNSAKKTKTNNEVILVTSIVCVARASASCWRPPLTSRNY